MAVARSGQAPLNEIAKDVGLLMGFRVHDLRHYLAGLIIGKGCVARPTIQAPSREHHDHAQHPWARVGPDNDETTRSAIRSALRVVSNVASGPRPVSVQVRD